MFFDFKYPLQLIILMSLRLGLEMFAPQPMWPVLAIDDRPWWVHSQKVTRDLDVKLGIWFDSQIWNLELLRIRAHEDNQIQD